MVHRTNYDLSDPILKHNNFPWYLPSINSPFAGPLGQDIKEFLGTKKDNKRTKNPTTIPNPELLNFLLDTSYFYYPRAMFSAGMSPLKITGKGSSSEVNKSILKRNKRNTWTLAGSGGFQISTNNFKIKWNNPDPTLLENLKWQEHMCSVGMHLEVPLRTIANNESPFYNDIQKCIEQSVYNFEFFDKHKSPEFELLVPLHSYDPNQKSLKDQTENATIEEAIRWYEAVKHINCIGYAVGAPLLNDYAVILQLINYIKEDGGFEGKRGRFFHMFGKGTVTAGINCTVLQKLMRHFVSKDMQVTFDASSPVQEGGKRGNAAHQTDFPPTGELQRQKYESFSAIIRNKDLDGVYNLGRSPVIENISFDDILNPNTKSKYKMDMLSYAVAVSHNVYTATKTIYDQISKAVIEAGWLSQQLESGEDISPFVDWEKVLKKQDLGAYFLTLERITAEIFAYSHNPIKVDDLLIQHRKLLDSVWR